MNDFAQFTSLSGEMPSLRRIDAEVRITGRLAETTLRQHYENSSGSKLELSYTFPLPVAATLLSFSVLIDEREYRGEVIPRAEAEVGYENAIAEGNSAFRLQELKKGLYNATLGNVLPGETLQIRLHYAETLAWNGQRLRYRLPTTLAPRYGTPEHITPWQRPTTSLLVDYPFTLTATLAAPLAEGHIGSPSHHISQKHQDGETCLCLEKGATLDRDFVLDIACAAISSLAVAASAHDTHLAMLTLLPPEMEGAGPKRDLVFVIDCSGSMQGDSLALARAGVRLALASLAATEHFGIVAFGDSFLKFNPALQSAQRKTLNMAERWLEQLGNLGGTNIDGALTLALGFREERDMDILLLTDGQDWQRGNATEQAKAAGVRIFPLGIGSAVAEDTVHRMAVETGGACELIAPNEDMAERIHRHFKRMRQPQISQLTIDWPQRPLWEHHPAQACFAGDAYSVFAALPEPVVGQVRATVQLADRSPRVVDIPLADAGNSADAIVRLGAAARLPALAEAERQAWAVRYQLLSERTDYLITHVRADADKADGLPALQIQPHMLPAGWGGASAVMAACPPAPAGIDYSQLDLPAVVRSRNSSLPSIFDGTFTTFIAHLEAQAKQSLPGNCDKLRRMLPKRLLQVLDRQLAEQADQQVLAAFWQALIDEEKMALSRSLARQLKVFAVTHPPLPENVTAWRAAIASWRTNPLPNDYDIPPFLRKNG